MRDSGQCAPKKAAAGWSIQVAFFYFASAADLAEICADIEAEAPVRVVHQHDTPGSEKQYYFSLLDIPGIYDDGPLIRRLPSFLAFPFQVEPRLTDFDTLSRRFTCIDREDNPDAVEIRPPALLYVDGFDRPELNAGEVSCYAGAGNAGEPRPSAAARALANRVRKAIRRRSCLMHGQGRTRVYIARGALEMARRKEINLACGWDVWLPAESQDDAARLEKLDLPKSAIRPVPGRAARSHNVTAMRKFQVQTIEFNVSDEPDQLFVAAYDDLKALFDAACDAGDMHYSRLGPAQYRSICQSAGDLPGLGASRSRREIEAGIIAWREETGDYDRVREPSAVADYRICLLREGYSVPSIAVFPGGALLGGGNAQARRLYCGYARLVHCSGQGHFDAFREALMGSHVDAVQAPDLPVDIPVLPQARALIEAGVELDAALLSRHILHHRASTASGKIVAFPGRTGSDSG